MSYWGYTVGGLGVLLALVSVLIYLNIQKDD
jgi:hypothetical protein